MSQYKLTLAAKAPLVGYAALIGSFIINHEEPTSPIDLSFVDAAVVDSSVPESNTVLTHGTEGKSVYGTVEVLNALAEAFPNVLPVTPAASEWIEFAFKSFSGKDFKTLTPSLEKLEAHLNFRSFVLGDYRPSIADVALWGVLRANAVVGASCKNGTFINIARWYKYFDTSRFFGGAVETMNKEVLDIRKQSKVGQKKESKASYDIGLIDAVDGKVVTRFPPEPSGYLHIGHAKAAVLNQYFAELYHGKLIVRFDDTNPSKEKVEFTQSILEDLELLGVKPDRLTHSSDYFQEMYDYAVQMIKDGKAYCDDTPQERMREERGEGIASARRNRTVEENLAIFNDEMKNGTEVGLKNCLRAKISVDAGNKTLRDPVIFRCNLTPHHRTGTQWKMYPTYDFCVPIVDSIEGVTHALRTTEYTDRNAQYDWMLKALKLRKVHIWDFSRVSFKRTLLSKRKLQWFVDKGHVSGWDDPRFPTVRGVRRRGMTVEGLKSFIISQGPSRNILNLDWSLIWATNKKVIDPIAPRHSAVVTKNAVPIVLTGGEGVPAHSVKETKLKHKKNADLGNNDIIFSSRLLIDQEDAETLKDNEEFTLMDWGNAIVEKIHKNSENVITGIDAKLHLAGDFKKTEKKISWLADTDDVIPVELVDFDHLITKEKIEEGENFEDFLTPETIFKTEAVGDVNVKNLKKGEVIQFERKGFYVVDVPYSEESKKVVFFTVPDGKVVSKYGAKKATKD
ncbi:glutamate--tRNA ligase GUS1 [Sugiyamaella lignohabitans]|uniref:glutamate--tRNA ligase n=1 Tax=Sugiyamaella lignohabitans TaxID=796027 RepID=A0A167DZB5_9ASCO|nr:glutamate--tRNA ligase GUS1 [Sugiyamaella lignohabitans]ANB13469.1 glutamate--tRNA ligase GUS1 [Sugiyamaella lignohabitans]